MKVGICTFLFALAAASVQGLDLRPLFVSMRNSADVRYAHIALTARDVASTSNKE